MIAKSCDVIRVMLNLDQTMEGTEPKWNDILRNGDFNFQDLDLVMQSAFNTEWHSTLTLMPKRLQHLMSFVHHS